MPGRASHSLTKLIALFIAVAAAGCGKSDSSAKPTAEMTTQDINKATDFVPASQAESEAFVKVVQAAVAHHDTSAFNALLDEQKLVDRILAGIDLSAEARKGFMDGMRNSGGLNGLSSEIIKAVETGGDYHFVRLIQKGDEFRPLFRLTLPDSGGLNYHELMISRDSKNETRIADIDVMLSGEPLSQSIRRLVLPAFATENSGILAKLTGSESDFVKHMPTIEKINESTRANDFPKAMGLFATLPASLQQDKTMLMMKLQVAQQIGNDEYEKVLRDLELYFPNDPARDFRSMDLFAIQGKHDETVKAVDRLISVTQDPYLNILKIDSLVALNRLEEARKAATAAKEASLDRIDAYWVEIGMDLKLKDHEATARLLDEVAEKFSVAFNDIRGIPEYADFAASDVGKSWMEKNPSSPPVTIPDMPVPSVPDVPN